MSAIARAREDIGSGRLWKARDRLTGALAQRPHDAEVLNLLADVYLEMGDLPAAGRLLMLSDREDAAAREARAVFEARHGRSSYAVVAALPVKAPLAGYPDAAQAHPRRGRACSPRRLPGAVDAGGAQARARRWRPRARRRRRADRRRDWLSGRPSMGRRRAAVVGLVVGVVHIG